MQKARKTYFINNSPVVGVFGVELLQCWLNTVYCIKNLTSAVIVSNIPNHFLK